MCMRFANVASWECFFKKKKKSLVSCLEELMKDEGTNVFWECFLISHITPSQILLFPNSTCMAGHISTEGTRIKHLQGPLSGICLRLFFSGHQGLKYFISHHLMLQIYCPFDCILVKTVRNRAVNRKKICDFPILIMFPCSDRNDCP